MFFKQEVVPTLCFYNVARGKEKCGRDGSYYNDEEVQESCFIIFYFAEIVMCFSFEPLFFECCWWTPKIVRCFLVCPRLSNILSSSLFESACSFFNCFFILWLGFWFFFLFLFHEFFILHFISHLIYECLYNKLSYARILIGSQLWSIGGQTYRWRHHQNFF